MIRQPVSEPSHERRELSRDERRALLRRVQRLKIRCLSQIDQDFVGSYDSALKGAGIEFEETRPYQAGDDVRAIDWRVTARAGQPFVKLFRQERQLAVHLLVDLSSSMAGPSPARSVRDVAFEVAALLALLATAEGDRVGLTLFTDRIELVRPPAGGTRHALRLIRDLVATKPRGTKTDLGSALRRVCRVERRRGVVILLSDFLTGEIERAIQATAAQHELIPIVLHEPTDCRLPRAGLLQTRDPESGAVRWIDAFSRRQRHEFSAAAAAHAQRLDRLFGKLRIPRLRLDTQSDVAAKLRRFFENRNPFP